jgi:hypothetical protein
LAGGLGTAAGTGRADAVGLEGRWCGSEYVPDAVVAVGADALGWRDTFAWAPGPVIAATAISTRIHPGPLPLARLRALPRPLHRM